MLTPYEIKQLFHSFSSMTSLNINGNIYVPLENAMHLICSYLDPDTGLSAKFSIDKNNTSLKWEPLNAAKEKPND